jgi:electron transport complex protein RnfA
MSGFSMALSILASSVVLQNVIFARGFCTDEIRRLPHSYRGILYLSGVTAAITMLASLMAWIFAALLRRLTIWRDIRWLIYFLCVASAYALVRYAILFYTGRKLPHEHESQLQRASINGAAFGIVLITMSGYTQLWQVLLYAFGCCIGLTAAQLLIHAGHERIELCAVPKPFCGVPILMIYIGVLSLAIYGLIGHQLPT